MSSSKQAAGYESEIETTMNQPITRQTERNLKLTHKPTRRPADRNAIVTNHLSPQSQVRKKHPSCANEPKSQITRLQEDLKRTTEQLASAETQKKQILHKFEEAKKQLSILNAKYEDSEREKLDLAASEDARIQELRKLSQERDRAWQSELEAVQNQRYLDSAALSSAMNEIQRLKMNLSKLVKSESFYTEQCKIAHSELLQLKLKMDRTVSTVENLKVQLRDCEQAKAKEEVEVHETRHQLEIAKVTVETLLSDRVALMESFNSIASELEKSRVQEKLLEETTKTLQAVRYAFNGPEVEQLTLALETTEIKYQEEQIRNMVMNESAFELIERLRNESTLREADLQSALKAKEAAIIDLHAKLLDKESQLQDLLCMNERLHSEIREVKQIKSSLGLKLTHSTAEITELKAKIMDNGMEMHRILQENEMLKSSMKEREMEVELKRLRVQSEQWKKAAEAAMAVFTNGKNGSFLEKLMNSPFSNNFDDESQKMRNNTMLGRMGELWKKGQK